MMECGSVLRQNNAICVALTPFEEPRQQTAAIQLIVVYSYLCFHVEHSWLLASQQLILQAHSQNTILQMSYYFTLKWHYSVSTKLWVKVFDYTFSQHNSNYLYEKTKWDYKASVHTLNMAWKLLTI